MNPGITNFKRLGDQQGSARQWATYFIQLKTAWFTATFLLLTLLAPGQQQALIGQQSSAILPGGQSPRTRQLNEPGQPTGPKQLIGQGQHTRPQQPTSPEQQALTSQQPIPARSETLTALPILPGAAQMDQYLPLLKGRSVAVFANQGSVIGNTHLVDTLLKRGVNVKKIFSPEHGFRGDADAGEHVTSLADPRTGIPIISLYGSKDRPTANDLQDVDIMIFDIQDVGVRFYTYISSLQKYIESARDNHRTLLLLDRPNPNGHYVDGPVLDPAFKSFVGMQPVPIVYGMTVGEYARMLVGEKWLDPTKADGKGDTSTTGNTHRNATATSGNGSPTAKSTSPATNNPGFHLIVIPCVNYTHKSKYILPIKPSPNLPNMQSIYLYPSLCLFEGTAISLGRGTDRPFQQFGSPSFPKDSYHFTPLSVEGAKNPPLLNQVCYGYDLSEIDVQKTTGNQLSLKWLIDAYRLFPDKDHFFLNTGAFFNKLAGNATLQQQLKEGRTEEEIRRSWEPALTQFKTIRKKYLLYAD